VFTGTFFNKNFLVAVSLFTVEFLTPFSVSAFLGIPRGSRITKCSDFWPIEASAFISFPEVKFPVFPSVELVRGTHMLVCSKFALSRFHNYGREP
jgi:hypothetical protein